MPKITVSRGPTYAGHVDVTPADVAEPQWQPAAELEQPEPKPAPKRPSARARAGAAKGAGRAKS